MLYYVMRPDNVVASNPVFTRLGGRTQNSATACKRAERVLGRVYSTDGHTTSLVADYYVEPEPAPKQAKREYWAARNQAAIFA